jgi:L-alanine-DL-glutamate epimerase-like enolase superfamily enzyme
LTDILSIDRIAIHTVGVAVDLKYGSFQTQYLRAFVVEVSAGGRTGYGECSADDWRFVSARRTAIAFARRLKKTGVVDLDASKSLQRFPSLPLSMDPWSIGAHRTLHTVREGFSIALYDLVAKLQGRTVMDLLGPPSVDQIEGMPVIHFKSPEEMATVSGKWCAELNFKHLKLKLPGDLEQCAACIDAIRSKVGSEVSLQVDFNYAFTSGREAIRVINALSERFDLAMVEDPIRPSLQLYPLPEIRKNIDATLLIDGVAYWPNVVRLMRSGAADRLNHHVNAQGGIDIALMIAEYAAGFGIPTSVGSSGLVGIQDRAFHLLSHYIGMGRPCEAIGFPIYMLDVFDGYYSTAGNISALHTGLNLTDQAIPSFTQEEGFGFDIDFQTIARLKTADEIVI